MEVTLDKEIHPTVRVNQFKVISQAILTAIMNMESWFTITKLERFKAGIDTSGEGRENQSLFD